MKQTLRIFRPPRCAIEHPETLFGGPSPLCALRDGSEPRELDNVRDMGQRLGWR